MRTITYNAYTFGELSDEAKANAIKAARKAERYWDMETNVSEAVATIEAAAEELGLKIWDWSIGPDVPGRIRCESTIMENDSISGVRLRTWLINKFNHIFYEKKVYQTLGTRIGGFGIVKYALKERKSAITYVDTCCPFTGIAYDESFLDVFRAFLKKPTDHTLEDLFQSAVTKVCKDLQSEQEYQQSDEGIVDYLQCNEWEFKEDGELL